MLVLVVAAGAAIAYRPQLEQLLAEATRVDTSKQTATTNSTAPTPTVDKDQPADTEPLPEPAPKVETNPDPAPKLDAKAIPDPAPKPDVKPAPKPEVKPLPKPQPKPVPKKPAVPDADSIAKAEKTVRDLYKVEFGRRKAEDMLVLAAKLMADAAGTKDNPAVRFVLLCEARDLAHSLVIRKR